eukprot:7588434-Pyramimonas_sp.AAC.1
MVCRTAEIIEQIGHIASHVPGAISTLALNLKQQLSPALKPALRSICAPPALRRARARPRRPAAWEW